MLSLATTLAVIALTTNAEHVFTPVVDQVFTAD